MTLPYERDASPACVAVRQVSWTRSAVPITARCLSTERARVKLTKLTSQSLMVAMMLGFPMRSVIFCGLCFCTHSCPPESGALALRGLLAVCSSALRAHTMITASITEWPQVSIPGSKLDAELCSDGFRQGVYIERCQSLFRPTSRSKI